MTTPKDKRKELRRASEDKRRALGRRIYACLSKCETLEAIAHDVVLHRQATGKDDARRMGLLDKCWREAQTARQDADSAMHELGIGYHQIYP